MKRYIELYEIFEYQRLKADRGRQNVEGVVIASHPNMFPYFLLQWAYKSSGN